MENNIRTFDTGAIRDTGDDKEDYIESISWLTMKRYCEYMGIAAKKYGRGNWIKGIPVDSYEQSLLRHIQKYIANKNYNANLEPEVDHLSAALFNLQGIIHQEEVEKIKKQNDNTSLQQPKERLNDNLRVWETQKSFSPSTKNGD